MSFAPFVFKNFALQHNNCTHKIGTDSMLLGSWSNLCNKKGKGLDIGAGSGVLSFMLAQKNPELEIIAIEPNHASYLDLKMNCQSNTKFKISPVLSTIQSFLPDFEFDIIISNPPYYEDSFQNKDSSKASARHSGKSLKMDELFKYVQLYLKYTGEFLTILPTKSNQNWSERFVNYGLHVHSELCILNDKLQPIRSCFLLKKETVDTNSFDTIIIRKSGKYTAEYIQLTEPFHGVEL